MWLRLNGLVRCSRLIGIYPASPIIGCCGRNICSSLLVHVQDTENVWRSLEGCIQYVIIRLWAARSGDVSVNPFLWRCCIGADPRQHAKMGMFFFKRAPSITITSLCTHDHLKSNPSLFETPAWFRQNLNTVFWSGFLPWLNIRLFKFIPDESFLQFAIGGQFIYMLSVSNCRVAFSFVNSRIVADGSRWETLQYMWASTYKMF